MIRGTVHFTGLEVDTRRLEDRWIKGAAPADWQRVRFTENANKSFIYSALSRWLSQNTEAGRYIIYSRTLREGREITIAFEHEDDAVIFILADGKTEAAKIADEIEQQRVQVF